MIKLNDGDDDDLDESARGRADAAQNDHELAIIEAAKTELRRALAAKHAANLKSDKQKWLKHLQQMIAPILAENPALSNKALLAKLRTIDPRKYASDYIVRQIGEVRKWPSGN